jgi:hypothetical protein
VTPLLPACIVRDPRRGGGRLAMANDRCHGNSERNPDSKVKKVKEKI